MDQKTHLKKNFNKKDFNIGASSLKITSWYLISLLFFRSGLIPFSNILVIILKAFGAKIGRDVRIKPHINIKYPWKLTIGDHCWLADCHIENLEQVIIMNNVCISQQSLILTGNHNYNSPSFDLIVKPIILEDGVWIAARSIVCPGVRAASHSILTAGSVANSDMEHYTIYRGNPAIKIRERK